MAVLEIRKYPDPVLKTKTKVVRSITAETKTLIKNMIETMNAYNGIGLAANQVGIPLKIIVVSKRTESEKTNDTVFINPVTLAKRGKIFEEEGCLSLPGLSLNVKRTKYVKVKAINERGKVFIIEGEGLLSRVLQHEIDHLEGKVFIDRLSFFSKLKTLREIKRRKKTGTW